MRLFQKLLKLLFIATLICSGTATGVAQCFSIDDTVGCVPHTINITRCTTDPVFYDYGEGYDDKENYTFTSPGVFPVLQVSGPTSSDSLIKYVTILDNPEAKFSIYNCANNSILLTIDEDIYDNYIVDFGDGTSETLSGLESTTKTYADNSERTVTVTGTYDEASCTNQSTKNTFLFETVPSPSIDELTIGNDNTINLDITISPFLEYKIKQKEQTSTTYITTDTLGPLSSTTSYTITGLDVSTLTYDFQLEAFDRCLTTENSNTVSSIILDTTTSASTIDLSWNTSGGVIDHYEIIKNGTSIDNGTSVAYADNDLVCNETYCYQVVAFDSPTNTVSFSEQKCLASPVDTDPLPIRNLIISVENDITLTWTPPVNVEQYTWSRSVNNASYGALSPFNSLGNTQVDPSANSANENCYQLSYIDECDNSPATTAEACALLLQLDNLDGNEITLSWNDFTYFSSGLASYTIEFLENGTTLDILDNGTSTNYTGSLPEDITNAVSIRIMATSNTGEVVSSNFLQTTFFAEIHFPNAFTPNNDGLNDIFAPKGQFIEEYELFIYTRQGELIFHTTSFESGWDGMLPNNNKASEGVYSYVAEVKGNMGDKFTKKGTFTLLN